MFSYIKFDKAIEANLVIFDKDANQGEFTPMLAVQLQHHGAELGYGKIKKLHVPYDIINKIHMEEQVKNKSFLWGFEYELLKDTVLQLYVERGCNLAFSYTKDAHQDVRIVVAEFESGKYLLGSF